MKHPFLKSIVIIGSMAAALVSCSDDSAANADEELPIVESFTVPEPSWVLEADQTYLINSDFIVKDVNGNFIGTYDQATQSIIAADGETHIVGNVNLESLPIKNAGEVIEIVPTSSSDALPSDPALSSAVVIPDPMSSATVVPADPALSSAVVIPDPMSSATVIPADPALSSAVVVPAQSSSSSQQQQQQTQSSSSQQQQAQSSSSQQQQQGGNDTCLDPIQNKQVPKNVGQTVNGITYAYTDDCKFACWDDPNKCNTLTGGSNNQQSSSSQQQQQQSSSSQAKSSSSQAKSSSSQAKSSSSQQQQSGPTPTFTPVSGGKYQAAGWGSRYWDGCKPSCGWQPNSPKITAHSCGKDGLSRLSGYDDANIKDGGNAGVCLDQAPRVINNVAYAYAASHTNGDCGKCFLLEFDGTSHNGTETSALKGKKMVVMISNIGGDVGGTQFDIMIPGGGIGQFDCIDGSNALSSVKNVETYGGILTTCGGAKKGANLTQVKSCIKGYCDKISNADAKAGCNFMAEWYEAANNPNFKATEVQCPTELTSRF